MSNHQLVQNDTGNGGTRLQHDPSPEKQMEEALYRWRRILMDGDPRRGEWIGKYDHNRFPEALDAIAAIGAVLPALRSGDSLGNVREQLERVLMHLEDMPILVAGMPYPTRLRALLERAPVGRCHEPGECISEEAAAGEIREAQSEKREVICCWLDRFLADQENLLTWAKGHRWLARQLPVDLKVHRSTLKRYVENDPRLQARSEERDELIEEQKKLFDAQDPTDFSDLHQSAE